MLQSALLGLIVVVQRPVAGRRSGCDRDASLLLLCHPVHGGCAVVSLTDLVVHTGIVQNTLGKSGLACVDMCHDTDVPGSLQGILSFNV